MSAIKSKLSSTAPASEEKEAPALSADLHVKKTDTQRGKISGLGSIRISAPAKKIEGAQDQGLDIASTSNSMIGVSVFFIIAIVWVAYSVGFFIQSGVDTSPASLATAFITLFGPPALLWYGIAQITGIGAGRDAKAPLDLDGEPSALYEQAQDISSMTKAVLKSLQRARQGLRVEIRDFADLTQKSEAHIDQMSQSLKEKTKGLEALTEVLDGKMAAISDKAKQSASAWDQAMDAIVKRSQNIESTLESGADKIIDAADKARDKSLDIKEAMADGFESLNDAVIDISSRLENMNDRFEGHTHSLNEVVDYVSKETERLTDTIKTQIDDLEGATGRTVASVIDSAQTIQANKEQMEIGVRDLYIQSERVSDLVKKSVDNLKESVDYVSEQSMALEDRFDKRERSLKETVDAITKQADMIEEVGDQAANKLGESLSVAVGGAESISFAIRRAVDNLEEGASKAQNKANQITTDITDSLTQLQHSNAHNVECIETLTGNLRSAQRGLSETVETAHAQVGTLVDKVGDENIRLENAVASLSSSVSGVGSTLSGGVRDIQSALSEVDSRQASIESVMTRRVSDLNDASQKALDTVEDIRANLRGQVQDISALSGQLSGQGRSANEQLTKQKEQLQALVSQSLEDLERMGEALADKAKTVENINEESQRGMTSATQIIEAHYSSLKDWSAKAEEQLDGLDATLMAKLSALYDENTRTKTSFEDLETKIENAARKIAPACEEAINKASSVSDRYVRLREECGEVSESSTFRFKQFGIALEESLEDFAQGHDQASEVLNRSSELLTKRAADLKEVSVSASDSIQDVADRLRGQTDTVQILGDQAVLKMDGVQKEINAQFMDFSESVAQASMQLEQAGEAFSHQSDQARDEIDESITSFKTAGIKAREEAFMLTEATQQIANDTDEILSHMRTRTNAMLGETQAVLSDFKKTGDTITIRTRELSEQMRASLQTSEMYGREIKGQVSSIAGSSLEVAEQIGQAISMLNTSMDGIGRAAHDTSDHIGAAREKLSIEADRLMQVSSAALDTTKEASDNFTLQSEAMFKAVSDVQDSVKSIKTQEVKAERSAFLSSARFIVESLHSLSVDLSRMLEGGDVSERSWQAFQRGDVSVFTRKLAELGESWPIDKAREKFKNDAEFRTYIQRFIRQFEDVYVQASSNDYNSLLSVTIGSSDIAKLYTQLCKVTGRVSKVSENAGE